MSKQDAIVNWGGVEVTFISWNPLLSQLWGRRSSFLFPLNGRGRARPVGEDLVRLRHINMHARATNFVRLSLSLSFALRRGREVRFPPRLHQWLVPR